MMERIVRARTWSPLRPWTLRSLLGERDATPGNVGVCLSGGGSRAMVAGMGQLRGLAHLRSGGRSLLSQAKALSVVSGGAWVGIPYTFLHGEVTDEDFLGAHVPPEELTLVRLPGTDKDRSLHSLRPGNIGHVAANPAFGIAGLAFRAASLKYTCGVADHELWQVLMGANVLEPYGLFESPRPDGPGAPSLFTWDRGQLQQILADNPSLAGVRVHLAAGEGDPSRARRPYLLCHGSMLLSRPGDDFPIPAPMQMTPLFAGCVGEPEGFDANGHSPGAGLVASFAFDGHLLERAPGSVAVQQARPFSLMDVMGVSSAFLAAPLRNAIAAIERDPAMREGLTAKLEAGPSFLPEWLRSSTEQAAQEAAADLTESEALRAMKETDLFVPAYRSFSPGQAPAGGATARTSFADGGNGDNTGIAGLLAYEDIDTVIAFVNGPERLEAGGQGILDERGRETADSRVLISGQIPPLFGYQPHRHGIGYRLYEGDPEPTRPSYRNNQVFESAAFAPLLRALWESSGGGDSPGSYGHPAIARLRLRVLANRWYGVRGRGGPGDENPEGITLLLVHLSRVRGFQDRLPGAVRAVLGDFEDPSSCQGFPHYSTMSTHLSTMHVNLLAHQTAWVVVSNAELFGSLFAPRE